MVFGTIVVLFGGLYAYWEYQNQRAHDAANAFCAAAAVGSDIADAPPRLQGKARVRHGFRDNETRYVAMFPGAPFNASICEIELADRKVVSKRVTALED